MSFPVRLWLTAGLVLLGVGEENVFSPEEAGEVLEFNQVWKSSKHLPILASLFDVANK